MIELTCLVQCTSFWCLLLTYIKNRRGLVEEVFLRCVFVYLSLLACCVLSELVNSNPAVMQRAKISKWEIKSGVQHRYL